MFPDRQLIKYNMNIQRKGRLYTSDTENEVKCMCDVDLEIFQHTKHMKEQALFLKNKNMDIRMYNSSERNHSLVPRSRVKGSSYTVSFHCPILKFHCLILFSEK